jgi:hypothetical protein
MLSGAAQVSHQVFEFFFFCQFYLSFMSVTMVGKNKAVVCCLLATSAIMLFEKKEIKHKIWGRKWYFKKNISRDAHLLNELLETECLEMIQSWYR